MNKSHSGIKPARILVVDDEAVVLDLFAEILSLDGYRVLKAHDAMEALEFVREEDFDVVISDFRMPKINGEEFFYRATAMKPELVERFVFTSGEMDPETKRRFIEDTGVKVLMKPFRVSDVRSLVSALVARRCEN